MDPNDKLEENEVVGCDLMDIEWDDDSTEALIGNSKVTIDDKGKTKVDSDEKWHNQIKDASASDFGNSSSVAGSTDSVDPLKSSTSGSINSNNVNSSNSDMSLHDNDGDCEDYTDDASDYDDDDDYLYEDSYLTFQSQLDNVDLPPGVEASLPWLKDPVPSENKANGTSTSSTPDLAELKRKPAIPVIAESKMKAAFTSSSTVPAESTSNGKEDSGENGVMQNFQAFKQFDTVEDFSDHHYSRMGFSMATSPPKDWAKKIQAEWKILEEDLPETIFVRVYEARMELLRAVIIGPSGTPYHDGLFVFDCLFPTNYPNAPPMVYYYSGGLRLNPNLYDCGKVCLSLLGTWTGKQTEMWNPKQSTMLQVLVSIQALILNAKPFFNEPGYESRYMGEEGMRKSKAYNEEAFILSLKTMMYTLRKPPKYFEDFVAGHFRNRARDILIACKAYREGTEVGSVMVINGVPVTDGSEKNISSSEFGAKLGKLIDMLAKIFNKNGSTDVEEFLTST
ncbi:UQ_con domain-containing protein [Cephalotus follicularis]|uniref:E2 ubiquitin-conjugating enzyme n=1 Tax=Cephalotus follicularis TaxID=3775 RepID=A0A1Q3BQU0_CEPFO|nr:UQ_con domain-containing protein [Cephalotus follicularis]